MTDEVTQDSAANVDQTPVDTAQAATETVAETVAETVVDAALVAGASPVDTVVADAGVAEPAAVIVTEPGGPAVIINPTIGRMVWFQPDAAFVAARGINMIDQDPELGQPLSAQIVYVHDAYTVNLAGYDQYGYPFNATRVTLLTGNEAGAPAGAYARWMDYQLASAKA